MVTTVIVNVMIKPEHAPAYLEHLKNVLPQTLAYEGCIEIDAYLKHDQPHHLVMIEKWESIEKQKAYFEWRRRTGAFDKMPNLLSEPMQILYLEKIT